MHCHDRPATRTNRPAGFSMLTSTVALLILTEAVPHTAAAASPSPSASPDTASVLKQARDYQIRFRDGELEVAAANVELMEKATTAQTGNADLWNALGLAYVDFAARATMPGGSRSEVAVALQKGMPALNRALELDPDHAQALALRAGMRAMIARQMNAPQALSQAMADMDRAVELAPDSSAVRLIRAFGAPPMPETLRNRANEAADLDFLIKASDKSRAGVFLTILRADLHIETGQPGQARQLYQMVKATGAQSAAQLADARLGLLAQGGDALMREVLALRAVAGTQCSMCHGR
jgi:hypothetical protein